MMKRADERGEDKTERNEINSFRIEFHFRMRITVLKIRGFWEIVQNNSRTITSITDSNVYYLRYHEDKFIIVRRILNFNIILHRQISVELCWSREKWMILICYESSWSSSLSFSVIHGLSDCLFTTYLNDSQWMISLCPSYDIFLEY